MFEEFGQRAHPERLGGVVTAIHDDHSVLDRLDARMMRSLADDECVDLTFSRLGQRLVRGSRSRDDQPVGGTLLVGATLRI